MLNSSSGDFEGSCWGFSLLWGDLLENLQWKRKFYDTQLTSLTVGNGAREFSPHVSTDYNCQHVNDDV